MRREDIAQVTEIDREAFPTLWPPVNYRHELQNPLAHYIVAWDDRRAVEETVVQVAPKKGIMGVITWVQKLFNQSRFFGNELPPSGRQYIVAFTGLWIMADEAHIINVAVRESYRRQGIGELLLISAINLAAELKVRIITLEVRASNTAAQALYSKYGFNQVGLRRGYYVDDREDAILMSTEDISSSSFQSRLEQLKQAHSRKLEVAQYEIAR
jgi:ribosomal-protein-alanine N-acetyltransferase